MSSQRPTHGAVQRTGTVRNATGQRPELATDVPLVIDTPEGRESPFSQWPGRAPSCLLDVRASYLENQRLGNPTAHVQLYEQFKARSKCQPDALTVNAQCDGQCAVLSMMIHGSQEMFH
jgi:hypothetical protein